MTARALELDANAVIWQTFWVHLGHSARQHRTDRAVDVAGHFHELHLLAALDGRLGFFDEFLVQRFVQTMVLFGHVETGHVCGHLGHGQQTTEIKTTGFPVFNALTHVEQICTADQVIKLANAQLRHDLTHFFGDEEEVVDDVFRLACELLTQFGILCGNAHGAGVEVTLAHHDAAFHHQRRGGEAELISTQQGTHSHVATGLHLTVRLHADATTQTVQHQGLLGFSQTDFPRGSAMFDGRPRRSACAAVVTGDHHVIGLALGNACGNRADTNFGHQLHADVSVRGNVLQVVNQLSQVFDGVDVVVWRR